MKMKSTLVAALSLAMVVTSSSSGISAGSPNYPGDLTKGKHLTIYVEGLVDPSSGFFRVLNNDWRRRVRSGACARVAPAWYGTASTLRGGSVHRS
jgi:hypothetical protein